MYGGFIFIFYSVSPQYGLKLSQVGLLWDSLSGCCESPALAAELRGRVSQLLFGPQGEAQSSHPLVEEHVGVGGKDLVQAGFADRVIRHPEPLGAVG